MSNNLTIDLLDTYKRYMHLKIFIDSDDDELKTRYIQAVNDHNNKMMNNLHHIDAGFDLFCPKQMRFTSTNVNKLDYEIICSAKIVETAESTEINNQFNTGFYMYPRSSISKTNLRLANNIGIVDAGYRGHLIGMFDVIYNQETAVNKFDRYIQICAPNLIPIYVELVELTSDLDE